MRNPFVISAALLLALFMSACTHEIDPGEFNGEIANQVVSYTTAEGGRQALEAFNRSKAEGQSVQEANDNTADAGAMFGELRPLDRGTEVKVLGRMEDTSDAVPAPLVWIEVVGGYYDGQRLVIDEVFVK